MSKETVTIKKDASTLYWKSIDQQGAWCPSTVQHQFCHVLKALEGKTIAVYGNVKHAVEDSVYVAQPCEKNHRGDKIESKVLALPVYCVESRTEGEFEDAPVEDRSKTGDGAWWKEAKLDVVRVLTPWVDGFMAFACYKLTAEEIVAMDDATAISISRHWGWSIEMNDMATKSRIYAIGARDFLLFISGFSGMSNQACLVLKDCNGHGYRIAKP